MTPHYSESAICFPCQGEVLLGIHASPTAAQSNQVGALIIVGGPQYRSGSHRQFTKLARWIAKAGIPSLRFDYRGMGDSSGASRTFETVDDDIEAGIAALLAADVNLRSVVLIGLCDAASAALMYAFRKSDSRVTGLILQNPWLRSTQSESTALLKHYYFRRLRSREFWRKIVTGQIGTTAAKGLLHHFQNTKKPRNHTEALDFRQQMAAAWKKITYPVLLQLSGRDLTAKEFAMQWDATSPTWRQHPLLTLQEYHDADHTFSNSGSEAAAFETVTTWWHASFGLGDLSKGNPS